MKASFTFAKYALKNVHYNKINNAKKQFREKYDFNVTKYKITKYKRVNNRISFCYIVTELYATRYSHIVSLNIHST